MSVKLRVAEQQSAKRSLSGIDDDAKRIVVSFLVARDVLSLEACSRDWHGACRARDVWSRLVEVDFELACPPPAARGTSMRDAFARTSSRMLSSLMPATSGRPQSQTMSVLAAAITEHPYAVYKRYVLARRAARMSARERAREREAETQVCHCQAYVAFSGAFCALVLLPPPLQAVGKQTRLRHCLDVVEYPVGLSCYGASVFVWLVLLTLKLNGTVPDLPWFAVFAPLVVQAALFALSVATGVARRNARLFLPLLHSPGPALPCPPLSSFASLPTLPCPPRQAC